MSEKFAIPDLFIDVKVERVAEYKYLVTVLGKANKLRNEPTRELISTQYT